MSKANRAAISLKNWEICSWDQNEAHVPRQLGRKILPVPWAFYALSEKKSEKFR